ncbi:hypothetical protein VTL71DRAFT_6736 [Oculimacula yallundae]|uniref:Uncharacterized protein n=1 Tax=Oculimacula yallundae TaxID=86028 RepID=A0ABR4BXS2_9HELO
MTPIPSKVELTARHLFDPARGTTHILDLINQAKGGLYAKDCHSDQVAETDLLAVELGYIKSWEAQVFQVAFMKGMKLRKDLPICLCDYMFGGDTGRVDCPPLTIQNLRGHPGFDTLTTTKIFLFRGFTAADTKYHRIAHESSKVACDARTNALPYLMAHFRFLLMGMAAISLLLLL